MFWVFFIGCAGENIILRYYKQFSDIASKKVLVFPCKQAQNPALCLKNKPFLIISINMKYDFNRMPIAHVFVNFPRLRVFL